MESRTTGAAVQAAARGAFARWAEETKLLDDFDIVVLNLASRADRRDHMTKELQGLQWPVGFSPLPAVIRPPVFDMNELPKDIGSDTWELYSMRAIPPGAEPVDLLRIIKRLLHPGLWASHSGSQWDRTEPQGSAVKTPPEQLQPKFNEKWRLRNGAQYTFAKNLFISWGAEPPSPPHPVRLDRVHAIRGANFVMFESVDLKGLGDLQSAKQDNVRQCMEMCAENDRCHAITFVRKKTCYLKHKSAHGEVMVRARGMVSAIRMSVSTGSATHKFNELESTRLSTFNASMELLQEMWPASPAWQHIRVAAADRVSRREQQIGGSGGSLEPPGPLLEPPGSLPQLRTSIPFL
jgi:hypothetical protein